MLKSPQSLPPAAEVSLFLMLPPPQPASSSAALAATQASPSSLGRRVPRAMRFVPFICSAPLSQEVVPPWSASVLWSGASVARSGVPRDPVDHHAEGGTRDAR